MAVKDITVSVTLGSFVKGVLFLLSLWLLWYLRDIVLIVITAVVIASAMEPGVRLFIRRKLNRVLSVILMYLIVIGVFFCVIFFFIPPILTDAASFLTKLPTTLSSLNISDATHGLLPWGSVADTLSSADLLQKISSTIAYSTGAVFTTLSPFFGGPTSLILIVVSSFYFSFQETGVDDFLRVVTPIKEQTYILHLWKRSQEKIGKWMQGQLMLALIVGILLYLGLMILGIPNALLLAVLAAVFELIPVFGPTSALLVAGLYIVVQQFEAHLIYPVVVKKVVGVPPLLVILALIVGFKLVGFLGVLLSVPIAGAIQEFVSDMETAKNRALEKNMPKNAE